MVERDDSFFRDEVRTHQVYCMLCVCAQVREEDGVFFRPFLVSCGRTAVVLYSAG